MVTRRTLLVSLAVGPLCSGHRIRAKGTSPTRIEEEGHCLSQESASGYRMLVGDQRHGFQARSLVIAPAVQKLCVERCHKLLRRIEAGGWLVLESGVCFSAAAVAEGQADILRKVFGLRVQASVVADGSAQVTSNYVTNYVEFSWPVQRLVRTFHALAPIDCGTDEAIASFQGRAVCARIAMGKGGIVYLGTMLGPGLFAREREAQDVAGALLRSLA